VQAVKRILKCNAQKYWKQSCLGKCLSLDTVTGKNKQGSLTYPLAAPGYVDTRLTPSQSLPVFTSSFIQNCTCLARCHQNVPHTSLAKNLLNSITAGFPTIKPKRAAIFLNVSRSSDQYYIQPRLIHRSAYPVFSPVLASHQHSKLMTQLLEIEQFLNNYEF